MSVVVRMEMPKCCEDCAAEYDCMACGITGTLWYEESEEFNPSNGRLPDCPIICSLPEGHGRLVDADANFLGVIHLNGGWFANYNMTIAERIGEEYMRMVKVIVPAEAQRKVNASDAVAPTDTPTYTPTVPAERSET